MSDCDADLSIHTEDTCMSISSSSNSSTPGLKRSVKSAVVRGKSSEQRAEYSVLCSFWV